MGRTRRGCRDEPQHPCRRMPCGFCVCPSSLTAEVTDRRVSASAGSRVLAAALSAPSRSSAPRGAIGTLGCAAGGTLPAGLCGAHSRHLLLVRLSWCPSPCGLVPARCW